MPPLRGEVESLLAAHQQAGTSFLKSPVAGLAKGTRLGDYEVLSLLGAGGMGEVYRARDLRLRREVAIKVLPAYVSSDPERLRRFEQEALATAALNHPNILQIFQMGAYEGAPYLVSELLEGETLREQIKRGRTGLGKAIDWGMQVARGLAAAHDKGIVHRDLKPENLFVTKDGRVKILDFGLAKLTQGQGISANSVLTVGSETELGRVMGTPGYMSPEQVRGESTDHRADIFAFGAILYEMLTGQRAFHKPTSAETMTAILNEEPPPLSQTVLQVPPALDRIVQRCLEKKPERRFQSASDLAFALEALSYSGVLSSASIKGGHQRLSKRSAILAALAIIAVIAVMTGLYVFLHPKPKLTEKDTIVLAPFDNKTGEAVFDDTLNQALAIQLEQSPFVKILPDSRIDETLKMMGRAPGEQITSDIAKEVCLRSGSKAVLQGSISKLGNEYLLGLRGTACVTGDKLTESQGAAKTKEGVLNSLSAMAAETRAKLGESLASVQKFDYQKSTTTSSLEALKAYGIGKTTLEKHGTEAAIPFFKRALELDPNFPKAYLALAKMYGNLGESDLAALNATKAYNLRDRVSEEERFDIASEYHILVTGDMDQAREVYDAWIRAYPRSAATPLHNRANILWTLGQYDGALEGYWRSLKLEPDFAYGYTSVALTDAALNRLDDAKAALETLKQQGIEPEIAWSVSYNIAFLRSDSQEMNRQLQIGLNRPESKSDALRIEGITEAYHGRFANARELMLRATRLQNEPLFHDVIAEAEADLGLEEALCGDDLWAKREATSALSRGTARTARAKAALALAEAGATARADSLVQELKQAYPMDTVLTRYWLPTVQAAIQIKRANSKDAVSTLERTLDSELGGAGALQPVYIRGLAYLAEHNGPAAIGEFQKILDHPGVVVDDPIGALARLQLGRAYLQAGDKSKAKAVYEDFLTLWKNADPDTPILRAAKAEYAKLGN